VPAKAAEMANEMGRKRKFIKIFRGINQ